MESHCVNCLADCTGTGFCTWCGQQQPSTSKSAKDQVSERTISNHLIDAGNALGQRVVTNRREGRSPSHSHTLPGPSSSRYNGPGGEGFNRYSHVPPPHVNIVLSSDEEDSDVVVNRTKQQGGQKRKHNVHSVVTPKKKKLSDATSPPSRLTTPTPLDTVKTGKRKTKTKNRGPPCSTSESSSSEDQDPIPNVDDDEPFHDLPSQLPSTPNWEFIGQRISKRFGSREVWYDHQSQLHNANTISEVLDYLRTSLEEIKDIVLSGTSPVTM